MAYTADEVQAFYDAAKAAYLKALKAKDYSHSGSQVSFSKQNQEIKALKEEMNDWQNELERISSGGGILEGRLSPSYEQ